MAMTAVSRGVDDDSASEGECHKGVKHLYDTGIEKLPKKYVLPAPDRPDFSCAGEPYRSREINIQLPVIDFSELRGSNRSQVLKSLANACEYYGCFQLVNHGISGEVIRSAMDVSKRFFQLCFEEREKYMCSDMYSPVRYGTSLNQSKDAVFCWRDFLKLMCHPLSDMLPHWPSSPSDFRKLVVTYANENKKLFLMLMEAISESLGLIKGDEFDIMEELKDGSQLMVLNCYPPCPEPDLTLGMPPHSDYGFFTLLQQDDVAGLQIQFQEKWVTVQSIPNSFVVMVGDHLEICSNGRYKSVLHRALVNSVKPRISVASLHSVPCNSVVRPSPNLIDQSNPRRYMDTDFSSFLEYISSCEPKKKNFLDSRKLI